jgi:hypothetical protein
MQGSGTLKTIVMVVCLGATIAGLINTYGDNAEVIQLAERVACGKPDCAVTITRQSRGAFGQSFTFQTSSKTQSVVDVDCKRSLLLVGEYACQKAP